MSTLRREGTYEPETHRARVGLERRQRTREHLIERSLAVFAEQGLDASIDDIIAAAGVSRGTFYNYFRTHHEVLTELGDALAKELVDLIEDAVHAYEDPVARVGMGLRLFLHVARDHARFGAFLWRTAFYAETTVAVVHQYLPAHIRKGIEAGRLSIENGDTGLHIVAGIALSGTFAISTRQVSPGYPEELVLAALLALGAASRHAKRVLAMPLPELEFPRGSLLERTQKESP